MDAISINPTLSTKVLSIPFKSVQRYLTNLREKGYIERIRIKIVNK